MTPTEAMRELLAQHDDLRVLMDQCEDLADAIDANPNADPAPLTQLVAKLRAAFEVHNRFEERLLEPILRASDAHHGKRITRMVDDHVQEHRLIGHRLASPATASLRDVIETLRAHLDAEERYLVSSQVLRESAANGA